jgi:hypothetical protein
VVAVGVVVVVGVAVAVVAAVVVAVVVAVAVGVVVVVGVAMTPLPEYVREAIDRYRDSPPGMVAQKMRRDLDLAILRFAKEYSAEFVEVEQLLERLCASNPLFESGLRKARMVLAESDIAQARLSPATIKRLRRGEGPAKEYSERKLIEDQPDYGGPVNFERLPP